MASSVTPNFEEAANIAADFLSSIDNLPKVVEHLLQEIKIKEGKCQELLQDISRDQTKYLKSTLKDIAGSNDQKSISPTQTHLPGRIASAYAQIEILNDEKVALAHTLINLLTRTRSRLDADVLKVRTLQGESIEDVWASTIVPSEQLVSSFLGKRTEIPAPETSTIAQINQSLRSAGTVMHAEAGPLYNKKRRLTTDTSMRIQSPLPTTRETPSTSRSRASRQPRIKEEEEYLDADAEGEENLEGEDADEDSTLYCFCQKQSYGDMIGCDNPDCPYQWFHVSCVGVKHPFPDKWYCSECNKKSTTQEKRKGRKK